MKKFFKFLWKLASWPFRIFWKGLKLVGSFLKAHWPKVVVVLMALLFVFSVVGVIYLLTAMPTTKVTATAVTPTTTAIVYSSKTETPTPEAPAVEEYSLCPYKDTGSPQPEKLDVSTFKLPDGGSVYAVDLSKLPGCAIVFEGRFPWQTAFPGLATLLSQGNITDNGSVWDPWNVHFIVDVRSTLGNFDPAYYNRLLEGVPEQYSDSDWFIYSEGSFWFYDPDWNISNLKMAKPSIAQELEVKKFRDAMTPGEYNYPRIIMQPNGAMYAFWQHDSGDAAYANGTAAGCTSTDQPEMIPVYGLWDGTQFSAAIGAGDCKMAYWADRSEDPVVWYGYQKDGDEIVTYESVVVAYMFPSDWTEEQVDTWIEAHPGGK